MKTEKIQLEELTCPSCITKIESVLSKEEGVEEARVLYNASKVKVTYKEDKISVKHITDLIEKLGYVVKGN
ncbi:MAG TPA: heavy metal-associated domain-containing protein [Lutibacter sp.]